MKILHYVNTISKYYGSYYYFQRLMQNLRDTRFEHYILAYEKSAGEKTEYDPDHFFYLEDVNVQYLIECELKPDVIHFDDVYCQYIIREEASDAYRQVYHYIGKRPCVRTIHDYSAIICPVYLKEGDKIYCDSCLNIKCLEKGCIDQRTYDFYKHYLSCLPEYERLFYFADNIYKILKKEGIPDFKINKIPPLIEPGINNVVSKEKNILFAGRLIPQKGVDYLLLACARLPPDEWHLNIAGSGDRKMVRSLITMARQLGIAQNVTFLGHIDHNQLMELLSESRVLAFSSVGYETYGFIGAEAVYRGVPVVAFDIEGIDEWLTEGTGIRVELRNDIEYAKSLADLLYDDEIYGNHVKCCLKKAESVDIVGQAVYTNNLYRDVASAHKYKEGNGGRLK